MSESIKDNIKSGLITFILDTSYNVYSEMASDIFFQFDALHDKNSITTLQRNENCRIENNGLYEIRLKKILILYLAFL